MWNEASETRHINDAISEVWQEKYDAIKQQNAELLAALKAAKPFVICLCQNEYQCQGCGIDKAIATVNKAIAKAEGEG